MFNITNTEDYKIMFDKKNKPLVMYRVPKDAKRTCAYKKLLHAIQEAVEMAFTLSTTSLVKIQ